MLKNYALFAVVLSIFFLLAGELSWIGRIGSAFSTHLHTKLFGIPATEEALSRYRPKAKYMFGWINGSSWNSLTI
jgi:hypothetical protein